ncbi:MAG: tRNA uridine-5-carboxymethylaminomethyl(34) synthesis enzyme MnmG [Armatimonadetes bacterium]|nr:tRNA uridine-5-carboxymethylaminomethyl(34) synthesis enzyme MnmG [Armatimonadota bacterium]
MGVTQFDVIVVGAGHAGIEACLAAARMGLKTACITMRLDRIGHLPCNCSVGGPAKGHMAREVDALGGQMAVTTDFAMTHIRRVGTGRGPAVQTLRAHVCKDLYPVLMRKVLEDQPNLTLIQASVERVLTNSYGVTGVELSDGTPILARSVVLTTGTFLNGLCHEGKKQTVAARHGDEAAVGLSASLAGFGIRLRRFKTGTTPRVAKSSIDFGKTLEMESELDAGPMSFLHDHFSPQHDLLPCWQTHTNQNTHEVINANLNESAMYSGQIQGVGPRYCPSIEDKIVRFADKDSHPVFLEQEMWTGEEMYVQGVSTSLPAWVQIELLRTIPGMENVELLRPGYAVEYDMADPLQLTPELQSKLVPGLFLAGQLNGTSGYEEAAGQGIVAGINAAQFAREGEPVPFPRTSSFIGVMVDDLTTKGVEDPYRMLTARAEHRLLLRHDNADERLTPLSRAVGLCGDDRWARFEAKQEAIEQGIYALENTFVTPAHDAEMAALGLQGSKNRTSMFDMMRRPEVGLDVIERIAGAIGSELVLPTDEAAREQISLRAMYSGYIAQQQRLVDSAMKLDDMKIPADWDYEKMAGLSFESKEKLSRIRPSTIGQASRIPGVRPTDIALVVGYLRGKVGRSAVGEKA